MSASTPPKRKPGNPKGHVDALARAERLRPLLERLVCYDVTLGKLARALNSGGERTAEGRLYHPEQVYRILRRLNLVLPRQPQLLSERAQTRWRRRIVVKGPL